MADSKREEFKNRLVQLCVMAVINGTERVVVDLPSLLNLYDTEISKAREEGKIEILTDIWDISTTERGKDINWCGEIIAEWVNNYLSKLTTK